MYSRDASALAAYARTSPNAFADVVTFVLLTIQQPLHQVARQMEDVRRLGTASRFLFGSKRKGYAYVQEHKAALWAGVLAIEDTVECIEFIMQIPGLGIVKAAFVAQILGHDVACIDTHNAKALGLSEKSFSVSGLKPDKKRLKVQQYVALCRATGGSEYWWNKWCNYVAGRHNSPLKTGDEVSRFHVTAVTACI